MVRERRALRNLPPEQFAYWLLTRSQRISHENLRLRDRDYVEAYEDWFAEQAGIQRRAEPAPIPPMFTPFTLRGMTLKNRVVVSPMAQYSCVDGIARRLSPRAPRRARQGGAGLVFTEMICVSPDARITPGCPGMWNDAQRDALEAHRRLRAHANSDAKIALQLGHAGAKGSTRRRLGRRSTSRCEDGNWPLISASPQQYLDGVSHGRAR